MYLYLIDLMIFLIFHLFYKSFFTYKEEGVSIYEKLRGKKEKEQANFILRIFAPLNNLLLKKIGVYEKIKNKLLSAKVFWSPGEFFALKELLIIFEVICFYLFNFTNFSVILALLILAFALPDVWLWQKIKRHKYSVVRVLPETVDLLSLCVGAGLDFMAAVRWIIKKTTPNPMIEELKLVLEEINVGKPRSQALRDMAKRLDIPDVYSFVRTLIQADRMGTPVEEAFTIISEDSRLRRKNRAERSALKAPIKMLFPLIFCIMPVVLIIVAGPILIKFFTQNVFSFR